MYRHNVQENTEDTKDDDKSEKKEKKSSSDTNLESWNSFIRTVFAEDDYDWQDVIRKSIEYANEQDKRTEGKTKETRGEDEKFDEKSLETEKPSKDENSANERLEEKSPEEIDKPSEDENSSKKKSVFAEDLENETSSSEDPPEDEDEDSLEYREKISQRMHDIFFS